MKINRIVICDDINEFPIQDILEGYTKVNKQADNIEIFLFMCKNNQMVLKKAIGNHWVNVENIYIDNGTIENCANSFLAQTEYWTNEDLGAGTLICIDYFWGNAKYNETFRNLIINGIKTLNRANLKMLIYTTSAQQVADTFVEDMHKYENSTLIGAAAFDMNISIGSYRKWKNIFKSVYKEINNNGV